MSGVLDASALLTWLRQEHGAEQVDPALSDGAISTVNASEVIQKLNQHGADGTRTMAQILGLGLVVVPFSVDDTLASADLWPRTRAHGLSIGDRACLALAQRLGQPSPSTKHGKRWSSTRSRSS